MKNFFYYLGIVIGCIIIYFILMCIVTKLWNVLMPVIFNLPIITLWQAIGLDILFTVFFSSNLFITRNNSN